MEVSSKLSGRVYMKKPFWKGGHVKKTSSLYEKRGPEHGKYLEIYMRRANVDES